jgi:acetyl-CoA acetyltransferase
VALAIGAGLCEVGIAGGAESVSDVPVLHGKRMARMLAEASRAKSLGGGCARSPGSGRATWSLTRPPSPSRRRA